MISDDERRERIVRCRDCKNYRDNNLSGRPICAKFLEAVGYSHSGYMRVSPNGFCAWGEERVPDVQVPQLPVPEPSDWRTMGRVSDEERREVARRLWAAAKKLGPNMDAHEFAHYTADVLDVDESMTWYEMELRLADLIEPSEPKVKCVAEVKVDGERLEKLVHGAAVELTGIDRDALLALADELEEDARWEVQSPGVDNCAWRLKDVCDRIREALGVES